MLPIRITILHFTATLVHQTRSEVMKQCPYVTQRRRAFRASMVARGLAYLGGCAFILLLLSATGVLDVFMRGFGGSQSSSGSHRVAHKAVPGSGHKWRELHAAHVQDLRAHDAEVSNQYMSYFSCARHGSRQVQYDRIMIVSVTVRATAACAFRM